MNSKKDNQVRGFESHSASWIEGSTKYMNVVVKDEDELENRD